MFLSCNDFDKSLSPITRKKPDKRISDSPNKNNINVRTIPKLNKIVGIFKELVGCIKEALNPIENIIPTAKFNTDFKKYLPPLITEFFSGFSRQRA